ncbi:MAG: DUF1343 domain-containing protein [bacterium]
MKRLQPGIDELISRHSDWLRGRRIGLVSHVAAVDSLGCPSATRLARHCGAGLVCIFSPEHGFFGSAPPGASLRSRRHPGLGLPVYSLYGETREPTPAMLSGIDTIVFDIQDIGARPYTYVSTLRLVLEAAAKAGKRVIVADRPVPLPCVVDGPMTEDNCSSFVSLIPSPMAYGMTPGEAATWLVKTLRLDLHLEVAPMSGYTRQPGRDPGWPPWIPPSPGIRAWESAMCFPATVCFEGLGAIDHGRATNMAFQVIGSEWMRGGDVAGYLSGLKLPGVMFYPHNYVPCAVDSGTAMLDGIRMTITEPGRFRPVRTAVSIIHCLQDLYGRRRVWATGKSRPEFFDKLFGTTSVREALLDGEDGATIAARWDAALAAFRSARKPCLLYSDTESRGTAHRKRASR